MRSSAADFAHLQVAFWLVLGVNSAASAQEPITGQCLGHESQPACVLPNLFGPTGLTVGPPDHNHHFASSGQTLLNQSLSTAIATQLAILPIISPASGFTYRYDSTAGAFVRTTSSFGPIYTE